MNTSFKFSQPHGLVGPFGGRSIPSPFELHDLDGNIQRARAYVNKIDGAITGESGHDKTFHVACILAEKFALPYDQAIEIFLEYNERCDPPWTIDELNHKLIDAYAQIGKPRPEKLRKDGGAKTSATNSTARPILRGTSPFTAEDVEVISKLRNIPAPGIQLAVDRGFLFRSLWYDYECFGVRDISGRAIELRRLDGFAFPVVPRYGLGQRKSHAIKNSNKRWPIGTYESRDLPVIALVEGIPDFLYAHWRVVAERKIDRVAVVAMLSASPSIDEVALEFFAGKTVRIFPHQDGAGIRGARKWSSQIIQAGASKVDFFNLGGLRKRDGSPVNDLCDLVHMDPAERRATPDFERILP